MDPTFIVVKPKAKRTHKRRVRTRFIEFGMGSSDFSEVINEPSVSIKDGQFLDQPGGC